MCDQATTSREHVPALCFFPETKDLPSGIDLRHRAKAGSACFEEHQVRAMTASTRSPSDLTYPALTAQSQNADVILGQRRF
jgi:hypothetical protein